MSLLNWIMDTKNKSMFIGNKKPLFPSEDRVSLHFNRQRGQAIAGRAVLQWPRQSRALSSPGSTPGFAANAAALMGAKIRISSPKILLAQGLRFWNLVFSCGPPAALRAALKFYADTFWLIQVLKTSQIPGLGFPQLLSCYLLDKCRDIRLYSNVER